MMTLPLNNLTKNALEYNPPVIGWTRFWDDIFLVLSHSAEDLNWFFNHMNNIGRTTKIQFIMEVADVLEFLDLKLTFDKEYKHILVNIFPKATNSFTYVLPSNWFSKNSTENVPKGVGLRLRRIFDSDDKFEERSVQYQKYLVARDYKPWKV